MRFGEVRKPSFGFPKAHIMCAAPLHTWSVGRIWINSQSTNGSWLNMAKQMFGTTYLIFVWQEHNGHTTRLQVEMATLVCLRGLWFPLLVSWRLFSLLFCSAAASLFLASHLVKRHSRLCRSSCISAPF
ncbi:hypothetical protein BDZ45DRAFT_124025 [Acephala macrosclerotiorum]|nr:hypothetical protein BDZ45DRAFT_124025 [Acephala macrosclerotiorum]